MAKVMATVIRLAVFVCIFDWQRGEEYEERDIVRRGERRVTNIKISSEVLIVF